MYENTLTKELMEKIEKAYKNETGHEAWYYDEFDGNAKIYYEEYVKWLVEYIDILEAKD